ncbi:transmembrane sensor [Pedobacter africanus]|uniref:Ferric-dicitrate binding protein FerR (Iron transport regulator) n=1 Tax=Pedobacter africanus TaxID=151894 RepID=A0ACC6KW56_9SPHI|nr:FecR domain-containing protein [Pedobacter africanus]MDR6783390.1 ferric-dicitrate binding protein FerR (iron transport regulator) [Pedobacter africanus]
MLENEFHISKLIASYMKETLTDQEQKELDAWLSVSLDHQQLLEELSLESHLNQELIYFSGANKNSVWGKVQNELDRDIKMNSSIRKLWPRIAVAVTILITVSVGLILYLNNGMQNSINQVSYSSDIAPGKHGATLTLANGRRIRLNDAGNGEIANEGGMILTKTADGQLVYEIKDANGFPEKINTLNTAKGETYILTLPDKSKVWLNAASRLTYSTTLKVRGVRRVKLEGEAYFEIAKDKIHPFVVESRGQQVEVLGTHFNVNAYNDEPIIATTLLEGSVKVIDGANKQILKPGEQALNNSQKIKVEKVNIESITDWKDGEFSFNYVDFKTAMRKIERWYNVEFIYDPSLPAEMQTGGWISRNNNLSSVLKLIESSGLVHFRIDGRKIYVTNFN